MLLLVTLNAGQLNLLIAMPNARTSPGKSRSLISMCPDYLPLNTGLRFSTKALNASRESSLAPVRLCLSVSKSMYSFRPIVSAFTKLRFISPMARGACPATSSTMRSTSVRKFVSSNTSSTRPISRAFVASNFPGRKKSSLAFP